MSRKIINSIAVLGGGAIIWMILSFLIYLPIDDAMVHPELSPAKIESSQWFLSEDEGALHLVATAEPWKQFRITSAWGRRPVILRQKEGELFEMDLSDYPHTRRCLTRYVEDGKHIYCTNPLPILTRDLFALTRFATMKKFRAALFRANQWFR